MKVVHVVPQVAREASGPSYSVPRLCEALAECGNEVELKCIAAARALPGVRLSTYPDWPVLRRFEVSPTLACSLRTAARTADIIHNHSLWSMVNVAAGCVIPGHKAKFVNSPRGTLSAWAMERSKRRKQLLWPLQRRALFNADLLHATSEIEFREIRALGIKTPVAIIPNGIDIPSAPPAKPPHALKTVLFLSRIHPKKGIDELLQAWQHVEDKHPDWQLVIAGTGEDAHIEHVQRLAHAMRLQHVKFPGPVYGRYKDTTYFDADLFVLPTHSENFGLVVAESLAHGCPPIVTHGAPWQGLKTEHCGWWIERDIATLADTLDAAMGLAPEELAAMGQNGRAWMARDFSWPAIARQMDATYHWLLDRGAPPGCVRLD